jgi:UDP-N-acetylmuramyl pentapeptide synthase
MSKYKRIAVLKQHILSEKIAGAITRELRGNAEKSSIFEQGDFFAVFLSVCNKKERAKVFCGSSKTLAGAWANAERKLDDYVNKRKKLKKPMGVSWAKADVVVSFEEINTVDLNKIVVREQWTNFMRLGVSLGAGFEGFKGAKSAFLENELNANKIIMYYSEKEFNSRNFEYDANLLFLDNINDYRKKSYFLSPLEEVPQRITLFNTRGFFCGEDDIVHELYNDTENAGDSGRRRIDVVDGEAIKEVIVAASEFLAGEVQQDGRFIYGYFPVFDTIIAGYNIVRHVSTLWSIINLYRMSGDDSLIPKIDTAIRFMEREIEYKDENTAYLVERDAKEIKLGANGVAVIMLTEYMSVFGSKPEYVDLVAKISNGILEMQNSETGKYWHVLHYPGFTRKEEYRIVYYDGEATFALARAYTYTKDERFLTAAKKAVDYFIENDYTKYVDHWIAYTMLEVTKYAPEVRYYEFALQNADVNLNIIYKRATSFHTYLEMLMASWQTYQRALKDGIESDFIKNYDPTYFAQTIYRRARHMLNGYFYPECAMYMKTPEKIAGAFMVRHHNFRTRIDDVQHFIGGYYFYSVYFDEIKAHLSDEFIRSLDKSVLVEDYGKVELVPEVPLPSLAERSMTAAAPRASEKCGFTSEEIRQLTGGRWYSDNDTAFEADRFAMYTAAIQSPKTCFIAMSYETWLKGSGNSPSGNYAKTFSDSHVTIARDYSNPHIKDNLVGAIVERPIPELSVAGVPQLIVKNPYTAMKVLAKAARNKMGDNGTMIAVTGAVGKSTTVNMLQHLLHDESDYISGSKLHNSRTGILIWLPSAARFDPAFRKEGDKPNVMTMEVAESALWTRDGGICANYIKPHISVITHNGLTQYQQGSLNLRQISLAMSRICGGIAPGGKAVMYRDMPEFDLIKEAVIKHGASPLTFGETPDCDSYVKDSRCTFPVAGEDISEIITTVTAVILGEEVTYSLGIIGKPGVLNSLAALTCAKAAGFRVAEIAPKLAAFGGNQNTMQLSNQRGVCLIDDSHNSPVLSAIAALELQSKIKLPEGGRRVVVLSRIVNMGDKTKELHLEFYQKPLSESAADKFFFHDPFDEMALLIPALPPQIVGGVYKTAEEVARAALKYVKPGDSLLVKGGSRGTDFGSVLGLITDGLNPDSAPKSKAKSAPKAKAATPANKWIKTDDSRGYSAVTLAGDTYFGEWYARMNERNGKPHVLNLHGYEYSFERIAHMLPESDYNIVNFEAVLTNTTKSPYPDLKWTLHASPLETVRELKRRNIHAVMLANNHSMDFGEAASRKSGELLAKGGLTAFGFGENLAQANEPLLLECAGQQVIIFNAYWFRKSRADKGWYATRTSAGSACASESLFSTIAKYREQYPEAFIVFSPHWGTDYDNPHDRQKQLAVKAISSGADCIIGHGAHIVSDFETVGGKFVLYSLGNFVFNSNGDMFISKNRPKYGYLSKLLIPKDPQTAIKLRLYPFFAYNPESFWQPYPVTDEQFRELLQHHPQSSDSRETIGRDEYGHYREILLTGGGAGGGT